MKPGFFTHFLMCIICLISFFSLPLTGDNYGTTVVGFYKSTDNQTEVDNELNWFVKYPLRDMGLTLKLWDIDKGLPPASLLEDSRGIITWFRGESMKKVEAYLDFLDEYIEGGGKIVVIDNFGAYLDRDTGTYTAQGRLNATLGRLGLMYMGDWTADASLLGIDTIKSGMVEKDGKQDVKRSAFYYRFLGIDRDMKTWLSLKRSDRTHKPSPVVVTNTHGGFALSRYIYRMESGKVTMLLNIPEFIKESLFPSPKSITIGLLADTSNPQTMKVLEHTRAVLKRAKLPFKVITKEYFSRIFSGDLREFAALGVILKDDAGLPGALLEDFQARGGGVVSLYGGNFFNLNKTLGIVTPGRDFVANFKGFNIASGFFLGEGIPLDNSGVTSITGYAAPAPGVKILGYGKTNRVPLVWTLNRGKGKSLTWNWDVFATGIFNGAILESFLYVLPLGVAGTPGIGIMFIDDWPLSMYNIPRKEVNSTDTYFYTQVWWPQMKSFFKRNNLDYSSFLVFNYNGKTTPPFTSSEFFMGEDMASVKIASEILREGYELGFHGYNHQSLTREKSNQNFQTWPGVENMDTALRNARELWISLFGEHTLPFSYVAPHNIISDEGLALLVENFPSIKVISTLRGGTGDETRMEYGFLPRYPSIYSIPRNSSGYNFTQDVRSQVVNGITGPGIWAHFIHADDIFDPYRSLNREWDTMLADFQKIVDYVRTNYPWLQYRNVRDSYYDLVRYDTTGVEFILEENILYVNSLPGFRFRVRLNDNKVVNYSGVRLVYSYKQMGALVLETTETRSEIRFRK